MQPISGWRTAQSPGRRNQPDDDKRVTSACWLTATISPGPVNSNAQKDVAAAGST